MYPKVKIKAYEEGDDDDVFDRPSSPLRVFNPPSEQSWPPNIAAKAVKHGSPLSIAKVPKSYISSPVTPPCGLPKVQKASEEIAPESNDSCCRQNIRASSVPRPRAVVSSPDNDQILGGKNRTTIVRPSVLKKHVVAQSKHSDGWSPASSAMKPPKRVIESKETRRTCDAKGKNESTPDIRVPRARIVKAKPCFTTT